MKKILLEKKVCAENTSRILTILLHKINRCEVFFAQNGEKWFTFTFLVYKWFTKEIPY